MSPSPDLAGRVALVAGGTRGAGRGIAVELGAAGATVYVTGRTTRTSPSPMQRSETIEETADLVEQAGGTGVAIRVDHSRGDEVADLMAVIAADHGRLDILVNDVWGGDPLTQWNVPFWEHDLGHGLALLHQAIDTHLITSWHAAPLLRKSTSGLIVEVTDGVSDRYRQSLFYDLAKASVIRIAKGLAEDLRDHEVAAIAISPGFLRSEAVLDHFGVTAETWRDAITTDPHFAQSESPRYIGRAVAALAADPDKMQASGTATATWEVVERYGFTDVDGTRPDWGRHMRTELGLEP
ncbi:MAG: SDR family oxidoreductase [Acidimicrobiia bacterium]|nr:SDR family oxidoreductase [Acidimicrobiia bacterium]